MEYQSLRVEYRLEGFLELQNLKTIFGRLDRRALPQSAGFRNGLLPSHRLLRFHPGIFCDMNQEPIERLGGIKPSALLSFLPAVFSEAYPPP